MKPLLFFTLFVVLFFVSCKKEDNSNDLNSSEYFFLPDSIYMYDFKTNTDSILSGRSNFSYDSNGNVTKRVKWRYDTLRKKWVGSKYEYEFNSFKSETKNVYYTWGSNNQWIINTKAINTYNSGNKLIKKESFIFNSSGTIDSGSKSEYTLNKLGIVTNEIVYSWEKSESNWIVSEKIDYITDSSGFQVSYDGFKWDKSADIWVLFSEGKFETDLKGNIIQRVDHELYDWSDTWHVDSILYKYDSNGNEISNEIYLDRENGDFFSKDKIDHNYFANGNLLSITRYYWNYGFVPLTLFEYVYNSNGNLSSLALYSSYRLNSLQPYDRTDYLYNSEGKLTYGVNYLVGSSKKKIKSAIYFSSKHNKQGSEININDIIWW
jgi:hypothetical protein